MNVTTMGGASSLRRGIELYCLVAGLMDAATGLLLVATPAFTLRLMGISSLPAELIFLRWIGVFVGTVGIAYLYPFLLGDESEQRRQRLRTVLEVTALVRMAVGAFVAVGLAASALPLPWATVALTDLGLAALQLLTLRRRWLR